MILPGATLGVLGGGQLGRMFTMAALSMGYRVMVLDPDPHSPAGNVASEHVQADYVDPTALSRLGKACAAVTTEFENVPAETLRILSRYCPVRPAAEPVAILQDRIHEKSFLRDHGYPTAPFAVVRSAAELDSALDQVGFPALLKVSRFGYDGKGQARIVDRADAHRAFREMGEEACVLERLLNLSLELSVVLARGADGATAFYPVSENSHRNGILDISIVPARVAATVSDAAQTTAARIADSLNYCGVMAVEFFLLEGQQLIVNEIAPRPHNSGHYTLDACVTTQFEQQVRALCALPLGDTRLLTPVVMVNLLGDSWNGADGPRWAPLLARPEVKLHLYGKREARPGRKMGHFNCLAPTVEHALSVALEVKNAMGGSAPVQERREPAA